MQSINRRNFLAVSGGIAAASTQGVQAAAKPAAFSVGTLKADYLDRPLGLAAAPRLSWQLDGARRGLKQTAWAIEAARSLGALKSGKADLWQSGRIASDRCFDVPYGGPALSSGQRVWWRVRVWDDAGNVATSGESWFEAGLLSPQDWTGRWLAAQGADEAAYKAAAPQWIWSETLLDPKPVKFRFRFSLDVAPAAATLMLAAKDRLRQLWVNGRKIDISSRLIDWGCMAQFPVALNKGANVVCAEAKASTSSMVPAEGGGLIALLQLVDGTGRRRFLKSGTDWRVSDGDATGWTDPGFDDAGWPAAVVRSPQLPCEPYPPEPARLLRRSFDLPDGEIVRARFYATALGVYEAYLNGGRIGDALLSPEVSSAGDHVFCQCHDVTGRVRTGRNALGAIVGDGWYAGAFGWRNERYAMGDSPKRFLAQLVVTYRDGRQVVLATDENWRTQTAPILTSEIYNGERYDARREIPGWTGADFDDADWAPATAGIDPKLRLMPQAGPFIRRVGIMAVKSITEPKPGLFVFDFGQNFSGWCRLKVRGRAGETVTLRYAEILKASGEVEMRNLRSAEATDRYTLKGAASGEIYEPHFTYHGFRYVEVEGFPGRPDAKSLEGILVRSDAPETGVVTAQNAWVQRIWDNAMWSQRSNFFGVPTDCPQRDERMGWMGDIQIFLDAAAYNMDVDAFIRRFLAEVRTDQTKEGAYTVVMPHPRSFGPMWTAGWSEAGIILPWTLYRRYGDTRVIDENWQAMTRWMDFLRAANPDGVWRNRRNVDLGDWLAVDAKSRADETTPKMLIATAYWAYVAAMMAEMAAATGRKADALRFEAERGRIAAAFARVFVHADGTVGNGSQAGYAMTLAFGLMPESLRSAAGAHLAADIRRRGMKLSTGFLGTPYLLDALYESGQAEVAVSLVLQTAFPSWGYMITRGATTMWERWNGDTAGTGMNSFNHYAYGAVAACFYRRLAGISPAKPGFSQIRIAPVFDPRLGRIRAEYKSVLGTIASDVDGDGRGMSRLRVRVPANAEAEIVLPRRDWRESGKPVSSRPDMKRLTSGADEIRLAVGAGDYDFCRRL